MVCDRVMVQWLADPDRPAGAMVAMVEDMITTAERDAREDGDGVVRWRSADDRTDLLEFCVELVHRLEPILRELVLPYPFESAKRFTAPVNMPYLDGTLTTVNLIGEMDLLVDNRGPHVWDLKGTKDDQYWRKVLGQLVFYDLAVLAMTGTKTVLTGLIQPMCTEPVLEFQISDDDRRAMWSRILRYATDRWRNHAPCKEGTSGCNWCETKHACPRFQPTQGNTMTLSAELRQAAENPQ
jgi:hypothetical protein